MFTNTYTSENQLVLESQRLVMFAIKSVTEFVTGFFFFFEKEFVTGLDV